MEDKYRNAPELDVNDDILEDELMDQLPEDVIA